MIQELAVPLSVMRGPAIFDREKALQSKSTPYYEDVVSGKIAKADIATC